MDKKNDGFREFIDGLHSRNREQKLLSISALGILRLQEHAAALTDLLGSSDPIIVEQTIDALGSIGNPDSVRRIVDFIPSEEDSLSSAAVRALQSFDISSVIDTVIDRCTSDLPPTVKIKFLKVLENYDLPQVKQLMQDVLVQNNDPEVLKAALKYFIKYPSKELHSILKNRASDTDWNLSLYANIALSRLKDESAYTQIKRLAAAANYDVKHIIVKAISKQPQIEDRDMFKIFISDTNPNIRKRAISGLDVFAADERISILRDRLLREPDIQIKMELVKRAEKEASILLYNELFMLLQSSDDVLQEAVSNAISAIGAPAADKILSEFDRMPLIDKEQVVLILGNIGGENVIETISECLFAKERWLRINAIEAASKLKNDELSDELVNIVKNPDTDIWVMATAISALSRTGKSKYADAVALRLDHEDARVRANAIEAISALNWNKLNESCIKMLKDKNDRVRVNAAIALWKNGSKDVFTELERMTSSRNRWVRSSAVYALGKIKDKAATPILLTILSDNEDMVYRNAVNALAEQGDIRALLPLLREMLKGRMTAAFYTQALNRLSDTLKNEE